MQKGFMFIDETISLDFVMSDRLKEAVTNMDIAFKNNDEILWDQWHEVIGLIAKIDYECHQLTYDQMVAVWERYRTGP